MTLPNKLTITRIALAPVFFTLFSLLATYTGIIHTLLLTALWAVFIYGEISDVLDGYIARKYNLVSDLGKLMDPFADVVSRITSFLCFTHLGLMPIWAFYIILLRELIVTFIRMVLIKSGTAMAASIWGKIKAVIYFITSVFALSIYTFKLEILSSAIYILFILSSFAALMSLLDYLVKFSKTDVCKSIINE